MRAAPVIVAFAISTVTSLAFADEPPAELARPESSFAPVPPPELVSEKGFGAELRIGALFPTGKTFSGDVPASDMSSFGPGPAVQLGASYYFLKQLGVYAGLRGSGFHEGAAGYCESRVTCRGSTLQLPLMLRFVPQRRDEGLMIEGGLGLLTTYAVTEGNADSREFINDLLELKLGGGWRFPFDREHHGVFELFAGADIGQLARISASGAREAETGSIPARAWHASVILGIGVHYLP
jgi:hypothetical protein